MIFSKPIPQKTLKRIQKALPEIPDGATFGDVLDRLSEDGRGWGISRTPQGTYVFATPTDSPYRFRRNTSADPCKCLATGILRIITDGERQ